VPSGFEIENGEQCIFSLFIALSNIRVPALRAVLDIIGNKEIFHEGHEFSRKTKRNSCFFVNFVDKKLIPIKSIV
jgi:hypothetical protein